ncbi:MAG TPA: heavy metal-associated domain-containing protein [Acidimicrobiales bacterium]|nr:heavy metal-associated domain-containing protein [Acidimicrobiales bacterium]
MEGLLSAGDPTTSAVIVVMMENHDLAPPASVPTSLPEAGISAPTESGAATFAVEASAVTLAVEGMHCEACAALIEDVLKDMTGVTQASVRFDTARAVVVWDSSVLSVQDLTAAIAQAGYGSNPIDHGGIRPSADRTL